MRHAAAYDNHGRWVVDCPNPQDGNAWQIPYGQKRWSCWQPADPALNRAAVGCGEEFLIDWPDNADEQVVRAAAPAGPTDEALRAEAERERLAQMTDEHGNLSDGVDAANARYQATLDGDDDR